MLLSFVFNLKDSQLGKMRKSGLSFKPFVLSKSVPLSHFNGDPNA